MKITSVFRVMLVIQLFLLIISVLIDSYFVQFLPEKLQNYLTWEAEQEITKNEILFLIIFLPLLLLYLASVIGLFFFKKWAKNVYIGTTIIMLIAGSFLPPIVEHSFVSTLTYLEASCFGFILALILCSRLHVGRSHLSY